MTSAYNIWKMCIIFGIIKHTFAFFRQVIFCIPALNCLGLPDCDRGPFMPHQVTHLKFLEFFANAALFVLTFALPPWVKCWIWTLQKPTPAGDVKVTQVLFCVIASLVCVTHPTESSFSLFLYLSPLPLSPWTFILFFYSSVSSHRSWVTVTQMLSMCFLSQGCVWLVGC